jgi:uncharacterized protein
MRPAGPFVLNLHTLAEGESRLELVGSASDLDLGPDQAPLEGPVVVHATVFRTGQRIEVQGRLVSRLSMQCDRCLEPVSVPVAVPLRIFAERRDSRDHRSLQEVREEDLGIVYHDGQFVALTEEVRQLLLVEVPWHVLCREDCMGLCPRCGANRNILDCSCRHGDGSELRQ